MSKSAPPLRRWLIAAVVMHLAVSVIHGGAHAAAHVDLSTAGAWFVFLVILAGPLAGVALMRPAEIAGAWLVAATMAASFAFGVINHFVVASPDHITHVDPAWRPLFAATAVLVAATEALGAGLAIAYVRGRSVRS